MFFQIQILKHSKVITRERKKIYLPLISIDMNSYAVSFLIRVVGWISFYKSIFHSENSHTEIGPKVKFRKQNKLSRRGFVGYLCGASLNFQIIMNEIQVIMRATTNNPLQVFLCENVF